MMRVLPTTWVGDDLRREKRKRGGGFIVALECIRLRFIYVHPGLGLGFGMDDVVAGRGQIACCGGVGTSTWQHGRHASGMNSRLVGRSLEGRYEL